MSLKIDLSGKLSLTTASSRGIGFGVAKVLALAGSDVILVARRREELEEAREKIRREADVDVNYVVADLTLREDLERIAKEVSDIGYPDIFFYSTGGPKPGGFQELSMEDWDHGYRLLVYPAVYLTRFLVPHMVERRWGRIVYLASLAIKEPMSNLALSNVLRISIAGLVRTLAKELGRHGVTVNGVMPGIIKTSRIEELAKDISQRNNVPLEEAYAMLSRDIPAGRLGLPEEIGYLVAFLASNYASYINGAMIPVDGGRQVSVF
jgi:3-oxoacyl-[acyl-carrier protein] reductase